MRFPEVESSTLELKHELPRKHQIINMLIGFCNQNGGRIVVGVQDDGVIVGVEPAHVEEVLEWLERAVYQACTPPILPRVYVRRYGDKSVLVIEVAEGMNKPYYRTSEGLSQGCYVRLGRSTLRATPAMVEELGWQSRGMSYERRPMYQASLEELDVERLKGFINNRLNHGSTDISPELLRSYHLAVSEQGRDYPTVAGMLLFGRNPQHHLSEAMVICSHFVGTSGREAVASVDCEGTLFDQFQQAYHFVTSRLSRSFKVEKTGREEVLEIPPVAVREALLNMLIHRNYHVVAPSKIAIFDDRVEVFSPGGLSGPLDLGNLHAGITFLRNPAICKVFREAGLVEKLGSGLIAIASSYEERGLLPPQVVEHGNSIKCILPRGVADGGEDQEILDLFNRSKELTTAQVAQWSGLSRTTVRRRLEALMEAGFVRKEGKARATRYRRV